MSFNLNIRPLSFEKTEYPGDVQSYFSHYSLDFAGIDHHFGYFSSVSHKIAAHIFVPPNCTGTVFLVHGYLDHTGLFAQAIGRFLKEGYSVACFDLLGHGVSEGERTAIDDFSTYRASLYDFICLCREKLPSPFHIMGFSTGCSILFEYLYNHKNIFNSVIFLAPLIRSCLWFLSEKAHLIYRNFSDKTPRLFRKTSSNQDYLDFVKNKDLFRDTMMSNSWFDALLAWNKRINSYPKLEAHVLIIQGDKDTVVEWKYNLPFLQEKILNTSTVMIPGARHQLLNESDTYFEQVFKQIITYFSSSC